jgi:inner membrane transporter RhtA
VPARLVTPGLIIASAISTQSGAAFAVQLFTLTSPTFAAWIRNTVGAIALLALMALRGGSLGGLRWRLAAGYGLLLGIMNGTFYEAIHHLPLGDAVAVEFIGPVAVAAFTSRSRRDLVWVALAALGVLAISRPGPDHLSFVGLGFIAIAATCWGLYILMGRRMATGARRIDTLAAAMAVTSLVLLLPALVRSPQSIVDGRVLLFGAGIGILSSAIPYSVELVAMGRVAPNVFGVLLSLQPLMAALMGLVILGQRPVPLDFVGFALVMGASLGVTLGAPTERAGPPPTVVVA